MWCTSTTVQGGQINMMDQHIYRIYRNVHFPFVCESCTISRSVLGAYPYVCESCMTTRTWRFANLLNGNIVSSYQASFGWHLGWAVFLTKPATAHSGSPLSSLLTWGAIIRSSWITSSVLYPAPTSIPVPITSSYVGARLLTKRWRHLQVVLLCI